VPNPKAPDSAHYDLHGLLAIRIEGPQTPLGRVLHADLAHFHRPQGGAAADLTIVLGGGVLGGESRGGVALGDGLWADPASSRLVVACSERNGRVRYEIQGDVRGTGPVRVHVPHLRLDHSPLTRSWRALVRGTLFRRAAEQASELTAEILEPFLCERLPRHGHAFLHAAGVCARTTLLITGPSNTGKTLLTLRLIARGLGLLGDDLTLISSEGQVLAYPKRVNLERQDLGSSPKLRATLTAPLTRVEAWRLRRRLASGETLPYGMSRLAPADLVPPARIHRPAPLGAVIHVRRDGVDGVSLEESDPATSAGRLAGNAFWEFEQQFWRRPPQLRALAIAGQRDPLEDDSAHHARVNAVLASACANARSYDLRLPPTLDERSIERAVELLAPLA
jgi:hypothetical protein